MTTVCEKLTDLAYAAVYNYIYGSTIMWCLDITPARHSICIKLSKRKPLELLIK